MVIYTVINVERAVGMNNYHTVCPCCEKRANRDEYQAKTYYCPRCCIEGEWNDRL